MEQEELVQRAKNIQEQINTIEREANWQIAFLQGQLALVQELLNQEEVPDDDGLVEEPAGA